MTQSVPSTDVVVDVSGDDHGQATQACLAVKNNHVLSARIQPGFYRLAYATQTLEGRSQCIWPTKIQHLTVNTPTTVSLVPF